MMRIWLSVLEPAVDEYDQLQRRLQIEQDCRTEAEKYACKVIIHFLSSHLMPHTQSHSNAKAVDI